MNASGEAETKSSAASETAEGGAPYVSQTSSSSLLVPKVSVVTPQRKEELLLKARAERRHWIEQVPLPYSPEHFHPLGTSATSINTSTGTPGNDLWTLTATATTISSSPSGAASDNHNALYKIHTSTLCQKYLPSATATVSELYGLPTKSTSRTAPPATSESLDSNPLNMTQVANRVKTLVAPYITTEGEDAQLQNEYSATREEMADATTAEKAASEKNIMEITSDSAVLQAYHDLWTSLLWPESSVLVQGMKNFLFNWRQNHFNTDDAPSVSAASTSLKTYCKSTVDSLVKSNKNLVGTSEDSSRLRRSLESFVYGQVREVVFKAINDSLESIQKESTSGDDDEEHTYSMTPSQFEERLLELQFVQPSHLEIACLQDESAANEEKDGESELGILLKEPLRALLSVDAYYSPFEKLQQILLVYQGVNAALSEALNKGNTGTTVLPSADDVLPTIILACIKARPRNLMQNLQFIEHFAAPEYLRGEAGYAYTNLYGAVQFLQDLDLKGSGDGDGSSNNQLSINSEDLKRGLEKCRKQKDKLLASKTAAASAAERSNPIIDGTGLPTPLPSVKLSVQEVHAATVRGETVDLEWAKVRQHHQPQEAPSVSAGLAGQTRTKLPEGFKRSYTFLNAQPSDIRVTDLAQLLDEYHILVQVTEDLLSERAARINSERKQRDLEQQQALGEKLLLGDS